MWTDDGRTTEASHTKSSPGAFGSGELKILCVCVCSNSRNDVPRVAQRYETIAAHTRRRASVHVVSVVFCMHMNSFAG